MTLIEIQGKKKTIENYYSSARKQSHGKPDWCWPRGRTDTSGPKGGRMPSGNCGTKYEKTTRYCWQKKSRVLRRGSLKKINSVRPSYKKGKTCPWRKRSVFGSGEGIEPKKRETVGCG